MDIYGIFRVAETAQSVEQVATSIARWKSYHKLNALHQLSDQPFQKSKMSMWSTNTQGLYSQWHSCYLTYATGHSMSLNQTSNDENATTKWNPTTKSTKFLETNFIN